MESLKDNIKSEIIEEELLTRINISKLPVHVAVIMDGNGRWAKQRGLMRIEGHHAGAESVKELVEASANLGIEYLTLYAFSKENWKRPRTEVNFLWKLLEEYLKKEDKALIKNQICLKAIGQIEAIPSSTHRELVRVMRMTRDCKRLVMIVALNYSGRSEILDAVKRILCGTDSDKNNLDEERFSRHLHTAHIPDPDLLIRTGGEFRLSNFLLWQVAYSEIWITEKYWPDFRKNDLYEAIIDYQKRERRFGDISTE